MNNLDNCSKSKVEQKNARGSTNNTEVSKVPWLGSGSFVSSLIEDPDPLSLYYSYTTWKSIVPCKLRKAHTRITLQLWITKLDEIVPTTTAIPHARWWFYHEFKAIRIVQLQGCGTNNYNSSCRLQCLVQEFQKNKDNLENPLCLYYYSSSRLRPRIRCRLLSKTALKDSRSARILSWNTLCPFDLPVLRVDTGSSGTGLDICMCYQWK